MLRKWNRILAFILAIALVTTTFGSDFASAKVYAEGIEEAGEGGSDGDQPELSDLPISEVVEEPVVEQEEVIEEEVEETPEIEEESEEATEETPEEVVPEEGKDIPDSDAKLVKVSYSAAEGGSVSRTSEEIDLNNGANFEGSTAEAAEGYVFVKWTDADGNTVSSDAAFVPAGLESDASFTAVFEKVEEKEIETKIVTVSYKRDRGGFVSSAKEEVDLNAEDAAFTGSTATAWKGWQFLYWTDENGEVVCNDATFVPADIKEDTTFTAKFEMLDNMPAIKATDVHVSDMVVSVIADEGLFPDGTEIKISSIPDAQALSTAQDKLGEGVTDAKGVDITFEYEGSPIQPAEAKDVHVTIRLDEALDGEGFTLLHDHNGVVEEIGEASADGASFDANNFSVFILAAEGETTDNENEKAVLTYNFYESKADIGNEAKLFNTQSVKKGESLNDPGAPSGDSEAEEQVFYGWFYVDDNNQEVKVSFGTAFDEVESQKVINAYAKIENTYYVTFWGLGPEGDGENAEVVQTYKKTVKSDGTGSTTISKDEMPYVAPKDAKQAFLGWSKTKGGTNAVDSVDAKDTSDLYPVVVSANWITFEKNLSGSTYTAPVFVPYGENVANYEPNDPYHPGYTFDGWYTKAEGGTKFNWTGQLTDDVTLYGHWNKKTRAKYTILVWRQSVDDAVNASEKHYDFAESHVVDNANVDTVLSTNTREIKNFIPESGKGNYVGFYFNSGATNITNDSKVGPEGDTIVNLYFDRKKVTINFYTGDKNNNNYRLNDTFVGLYGQTFSNVGKSWPAEDGYIWHRGTKSGGVLSYLTAFLIEETAETIKELETSTLNVYRVKESDSYLGRFLIQDIDNADNWILKDTALVDQPSFIPTNKYVGFTVFQYRSATSRKYNYSSGEYEYTWGSWNNVNVNSSFSFSNHAFELRFKRNNYNIEFHDGSTIVSAGKYADLFNSIPYDKGLSGYKDKAPTPSATGHDGFDFKGWYKDPEGKEKFEWNINMPANNIILYAYWGPKTYHVTLDKGAEDAEFIDQAAEFDLRYIPAEERFEVVEPTINNKIKREGWQLVGWFDKDADMPYALGQQPRKDINLIAKWRYPGTVSVVYDYGENGTAGPTDNKSYASNATVIVLGPATPKESYVFIGWEIGGEVKYPNNSFDIQPEYINDGKVTLTAVYEKSVDEKTSITYVSNYTGGPADVPVEVKKNESVVAKDLSVFGQGFERQGYEFKGWAKTASAETAWIQAGEVIAADNKDLPNKLYAVWKIKQYKVKFVDYDDKVLLAEKSYAYNTAVKDIEKPADPTRESTDQYTYTFAGWTPTLAPVTKNVVYKATYTQTTRTYTVTWKNDNGTVLETDEKVPYGTMPSYNGATPTKAATAEYTYTFAGWTPTVEAVKGDATYTATYTPAARKYKVTFVDEDGTTVLKAATEYAYGTEAADIVKPADPTKAATAEYTYTFAGWTPTIAKVTQDATYKATYTSTKNKYKVTWKNEDGTVLETDAAVEYGTMPTYDGATPTKAATAEYTYTFDKWTPAVVKVTGDAVYTATYTSTKNKYKVTFVDEDGKTVLKAATEYEYGTEAADIAKPADPTKAATAEYTYTFAGWTPVIEKVTKDATYKATYVAAKNKYTVTFVDEDRTTVLLAAREYDYGTPADEIEKPADPTKKATTQYTYTFAGWDPTVSKVTQSVTYVATYTETTNQYEVTFVDEDGTTVLKEATKYDYGTEAKDIVKPVDPTKKATAQYTYTFAGWTPAIADVTGNATYKATYTETTNQYEVTFVDEDGTTVLKAATKYDYGTKAKDIVKPADPTKEATAQYTYKFAGWTPAIADVTGNATYKATYTATLNKYTVTYKDGVNGQAFKDQVYPDREYGTATPAFDGEPHRIGWTFEGWEPEVDPTVEGDATYFAQWTELPKLTVTITGKSSLEGNTYKNAEYTVSGFDTEISPEITDESAVSVVANKDIEVSGIDADTYTMDISEADFTVTSDKYIIEKVIVVPGKLVIDPLEVTVTIAGKVKDDAVFTGKEQSVTGYDFVEATSPLYTADMFSFTGTEEPVAKGTVPGKYDMNLTPGSYKEGEFKNNNENFDVTFDVTNGYLIIKGREEKFEVGISSEDVIITYDGQNHLYTTGYNVESEEAAVSPLKMIWDAVKNFFTIVADAAEGVKFTVDGVDYEISGIVVSAEGKEVGAYPFAIAETSVPKITMNVEGETKDVTDQFTIKNNGLGDLIINPAPVTITAQNASKTVGGAEPALTALVKADNSDLDAEAQSIAYDIARESGEAVGTYAIIPTAVDGIKTEDGKFIQGNFLVTYVNGIFTISSAPTPPTPSGGDPTPTGGDPTPGGGGTTIPDASVPFAAAPAGGVLGATREEATNGAAVLGARRGRTEDDANSAARVFAIVVAAAAALTMLLTGKKKEEEEK